MERMKVNDMSEEDNIILDKIIALGNAASDKYFSYKIQAIGMEFSGALPLANKMLVYADVEKLLSDKIITSQEYKEVSKLLVSMSDEEELKGINLVKEYQKRT